MAEIVKIEGLADLQLTLQGLPIHLRDNVMYRLLRKAAAPILRAAKANAPVAEKATKRVIPGLVRNMLRISTSRYWKPAKGEFGVYIKPVSPSKIKRLKRIARKGGGRAPYFGDPFYYRFQEMGFHAVGKSRIEQIYEPGWRRGQRKKSGSMRKRRASQYLRGQHRYVEGSKFIGRAWDAHKGTALNMIKADLVAEILNKLNEKGSRNGYRGTNR